MTATMAIVHTSSQVEGPVAMRFQQPKPAAADKQKNRPAALNLAPFDAGELSRRLSAVASDQDTLSIDSASTGPKSAREISPKNYLLKKDRQKSFNGPSSPRTIPGKESSPRSFAPKLSIRKQSTSESTPRRGSIFDRVRWKSSNYDEKEEEEKEPTTPAYRHVPKVAAAQFARTTTVETVSQKVSTTGASKQSPNSGSFISPMSPQDYNKAYRRAQSLCSGRPYERKGSYQRNMLTTTAEVDEGPNQYSVSSKWSRGYDANGVRRMSTGQMYSRTDVNAAMGQLRRDSAGVVSYQRRDSQSSGGYRRDSASSGPLRRDSTSSGNTSRRRGSDRHDSNPISPLRAEFDTMAHMRRDSEAKSLERRPSLAAAAESRVDWSQSDEPVKFSGSLGKGESQWKMKGRLGSISKEPLLHAEEVSSPLLSPRSPKSGFLSKFKRQ